MQTESRIGLVGALGLLAGMSSILVVSPEKDIPVIALESEPIGEAPSEAAWVQVGKPTDATDPVAGAAAGTAVAEQAGRGGVNGGEDDPGGVFQLLREIQLGYKGPVVDVVQDRRRFERFFPAAKEGPRIAGEKYLTRPDDVVEEGAILAFPKGVFWLRNLMHYRRWFPADVTIRGAGMEETLLYMDPVRSQGLVRNLRIESCTLFVAGTLLHLGNGPVTLRCEGVRFLGFDTTGGLRHRLATPALVTGAAALHFVDCRFEGGYGDNPTEGALLQGWSPALMARFDRCHFSRLHLHVPNDPATVVFQDCVLEDLCQDPRRQAARNLGMRFVSCRFENNWLPHQRRELLFLEVLFPQWRERLVE